MLLKEIGSFDFSSYTLKYETSSSLRMSLKGVPSNR
jgi:hypothetical protein